MRTWLSQPMCPLLWWLRGLNLRWVVVFVSFSIAGYSAGHISAKNAGKTSPKAMPSKPPPLPPPPASSTKGRSRPTVARLTKEDKEQLEESGRAIFV